MNKTFLSISFMLTVNFTLMKHPLSMGLILLIQTLMVSMITGYLSYTFWFAYILFLIMIGGMMVLFIYMTSLASNEMFKFKINNILINMMIFLLLTMILFLIDKNFFFQKNLEMMSIIEIQSNENFINLIKLYNTSSINITIMLMNYLLLALIIIVKITNINYGPLRQMF